MLFAAPGLFALMLTWAFWLPPSRELLLKLRTLSDMARRAQPALYEQQLRALDPCGGERFKHKLIARMLRADISQFGAICLRLQGECKKLDRRAHVALWPVALYAAGVATWAVLR